MSIAELPKPTDWDSVVADNIRGELARERWTGRRAAGALGVTQNYIARRLSGATPMSPADLQMFAGLLGVPVSRFFRLPDLDSNQEPIGSLHQLADYRAEKLAAHASVASDKDATVTQLPWAVGH